MGWETWGEEGRPGSVRGAGLARVPGQEAGSQRRGSPEAGRASGPGRGRVGLQPTRPIQSHEKCVVWINMQVLPGFLCGWADSRTWYSSHP